MATNRSSTDYTNRHTNKYLADARDFLAQVIAIYFEVTIVSAAATDDTYDLIVIPAEWTVVGLHCTTDGLGRSAGDGCTLAIGDTDDDNRYMVATDFDVLNAQGVLAYAGVGYRPSSDTIVEGKIQTAAAVVGQVFKGHFLLGGHG